MKFSHKYELGEEVYYPSADRSRAVVIKDNITAIVFTSEGVKYMTPTTQYGLDEKMLSKTFKRGLKNLDLELLQKRDEVVSEIDSIREKLKTVSKNDALYDATAKDGKEN